MNPRARRASTCDIQAVLHATRVEHVGSASVPGLGGRPVIAAVVIAAVDTQPAIIADMSRAVGASDQPPVERIDWYLDVDADATPDTLEFALGSKTGPGSDPHIVWTPGGVLS